MKKKKSYKLTAFCNNCGGVKHCGKNYKRKEKETSWSGMIRKWYILVCANCTCIRCEKRS